MMKKSLSAALCICVLVMGLAGCQTPAGSASPSSAATPAAQSAASAVPDAPAGPASELKVALVPTVAGIGDEAFNDAVYAGMTQYCDENGIELTVVQPQELQDFSVNFTSLGEQGYDLVVTCENSINEILSEVAPEFPDTHYVVTEGSVADLDNVTCLQFRTQDIGFLCGAFGAEMSRALGGDGTMAWVGGVRNPLSESTQFSTQAGAAYMDGECKTVYVGSYSDAPTAKEIALQLYNEGCPIVAAFAGGSNAGVFQAAETFAEGKYAMGAATGQFHLSPDRIIASNVKALDTYLYNVCGQFAAGELPSGIVVGGFADAAIDLRYSPNSALSGLIPQEVSDKMEALKGKIISGEIVAPTTQEEYDAFIASL